ncbi:MAG: FAD-dependent oxidoreductase, partial [Oscillospiraceae bacterium]|nr:FAD-dependent oxidoreductase [Oscillospiraceae bacterium]
MSTILGTTEIAVIGAGHAGVEAALAAARLGCDVTLFTMRLEDIANLPCNPSVGGAGKGQIVFEVDALGGEMGVCADHATIQSRTLNLSKGPAVHSKRVQTDRELYQRTMRRTVESTAGLRVYQTEIADILFEGKSVENPYVTGVVTVAGGIWLAKRVIIATGTYLRGRIFIGEHSDEAG